MAASCRVDDKLSYKLNTSGMKMHYPGTSSPVVGERQQIEGRDSVLSGKLRESEQAKRVSRFLCAATI